MTLTLAKRDQTRGNPNMNIFQVIKEVITPGSLEFKAHLTRLNEREQKILKHLQRLEEPATQDLTKATDQAAEF